ncbi:MAG: NAD(P)-dependent oxidoreductase [Pseudooceanicola sp.]
MTHSAAPLILAPNAKAFAAEIAAIRPDLAIATARTLPEAMDMAADVEILITLGSALTPELLAAMPNLQWIQALSAGTDSIERMPGLSENVAVTSLAGAHGPQMSELAIMAMLALPRNLRQTLADQSAHRWNRVPQPTLEGKRLCILGLGAIAEALIARALPFGVTITGVSDGRREMNGVSRLYPYADLALAAAEADFLCVLAPLSARSRAIVNTRVLRALGPDGYLISMGRGPVIDETALAQSLRDNTIAGAALDVFATEPLPKDSPFWDMGNVIITPHVGGFSDRYAAQAAPIVAANIDAFAHGGAGALNNRVR